MNDLVRVSIPALAMDIDELAKVLESSVYPGAAIASIKLVVGNCKAQHLDPLTKPFHIVPMSVKQKVLDKEGKQVGKKTEYVMRDVIMPGIELYRTKAARTREYAGIDESVFGDDITEDLGGEPKKEWDDQAQAYVAGSKKWDVKKVTYPAWCSVTVYRLVGGETRAFNSGRVRWKETYATANADTSLPNAMWLKRGYGQIEKCAEALALRRAFPEIGGEPTREELEGKVLDATGGAGATIEGESKRVLVEQPRGNGEPEKTDQQPTKEQVASDKKDDDKKPETKLAGKVLDENQLKPIRLNMTKHGVTDDMIKAKFGKPLIELDYGQFIDIIGYVKSV